MTGPDQRPAHPRGQELELQNLPEAGKRAWDLLLLPRDPEGLRFPNEVVYCDPPVFRVKGDTCSVVKDDYFAPSGYDGDYDKVKHDWIELNRALLFEALREVEPGTPVVVHGKGIHVWKDVESGYGWEGHDLGGSEATDVTIRIYLSDDTQTAELAVSPDTGEKINSTPYVIKRTKNYPLLIHEVKVKPTYQEQFDTTRRLLLRPGGKQNEHMQWEARYGFSVSELGGHFIRYSRNDRPVTMGDTGAEDLDRLEISKELWIQTVDLLRPNEIVECKGRGHRTYRHVSYEDGIGLIPKESWDDSRDVEIKIEARLSGNTRVMRIAFSFRPLGSDESWKIYESVKGEYRKESEKDIPSPMEASKEAKPRMLTGDSIFAKKDFDADGYTPMELLIEMLHNATPIEVIEMRNLARHLARE